MPGENESKVEKIDLYVGAEAASDLDEGGSGDRGDTFEPTEGPDDDAATVVEPETPAKTPEASDEAPETPAETPEKPAEPVAEGEPTEPRIPKSRFDQVNERRKAAEQRLRELETQLQQAKQVAQPAVEFDFDGKEQAYMEAVVDGNFDTAKQLRAEIRAAERQVAATVAAQYRDQASEETIRRMEFDKTVTALQAEFPIYDPEAEGYDEVLTTEALEVHQGLLSTGKYSPAQALRKAAVMVAKANNIGVAAPPAAPVAPARDVTTNVAKKATAANAQPPKMGVGGKMDRPVNPIDMDEKEFDSLPEATLRRLRGDVI